MSKKDKKVGQLLNLDEFQKERSMFDQTSFWTYLRRLDEGNVERKLRVNIVYPVKRFLNDIKYWFIYRFHPKHKYWLINTGLDYHYYDTDVRMLHACFHLLKEYVEVELAWSQYGCDKKERENKPRWMTAKRYVKKNGRDLGLKHLNAWFKEENIKDSGMSPKEMLRYQKKDKEIVDLYLWWCDQRVNRE